MNNNPAIGVFFQILLSIRNALLMVFYNIRKNKFSSASSKKGAGDSPLGAESLRPVIAKAIKQAKTKKVVALELRGAKVTVTHESNVEQILGEFNDKFNAKLAAESASKSAFYLNEIRISHDMIYAAGHSQEEFLEKYSSNVGLVDYVDCFACIIQDKMNKGFKLNQAAKIAVELLTHNGLPLTHFNEAVKILNEYWTHGRELSIWASKNKMMSVGLS